MSGLVGVVAQETARFSMFGASLTGLERPEGTQIKWWFGHDIAENANALVREMYELERDWLWLLGDDHSFSPTLLTRLLAHDVDVVVPLCLMRNPPYKPVVSTGWDDEEAGTRKRLHLDDYPAGGLIEVHSAGSGGMLIRRVVFDALTDPWFEAGVLSPVQLGEDVYFCDKARGAGFTIHADLDSPLGHCTTGVVWPVKEADGWTFGFSFMGGFQITLPPVSSWKYAEEKAQG